MIVQRKVSGGLEKSEKNMAGGWWWCRGVQEESELQCQLDQRRELGREMFGNGGT